MKRKPCGSNMAAAVTSKSAAPQGLPMLMIPSDLPQERFYSVFEKKFLDNSNIQIPMPRDTHRKSGKLKTVSYCVGCANGWFAWLVQDYTDNNDPPVINFINPFRKDQLPISLPPIYGILSCEDIRVITSADLTCDPDNCVVIAMSTNGSSLSFIKGGQKNWTCLEAFEVGEKYLFSDAIFYKGQVYAVENRLGRIVSFNVDSSQPGVAVFYSLKSSSNMIQLFDSSTKRVEYVEISNNNIRRHKALPPSNHMFRSSVRAYFVKSTTGDLLHVRRFLIIVPGVWEVVESFFMVYKLVFDDEGNIVQQVEVTSIGDEALFVGDHSASMSLLASNYPGCHPNSIYYVDQSQTVLQVRNNSEVFQYHMAGVFNLENGTSTLLYSKKYYKPEFVSGPALWFMQPV